MTKQELEDYFDLCLEIRELENQIAEKENTIVKDTVKSAANFPYSMHQVPVEGIPDTRKEYARLKRKREKLSVQKKAVEEFIDRLPNSRQRRIVRYRVVDCLSWNDVAAKMGYKYTANSACVEYSRILKNNKIV